MTSSISVRTYYKGLSERINTLQLTYTINPKDEELATKMDYEIPVATTKCNYGGYRYWFKCPLYKKGTYCGRKVTKLYQLPNSNYFGCRHCGGLRYESQRTKPQVGLRAVYSFYTLDDMEDSIKKWSYKGKPTKKANRYYQLLTRAHMQLRFL